METIGILGGTFDPVHNGHLSIAQQVARARALKTVLLVVSSDPPHKASSTPAADRLKMCRLAVKGLRGLAVSDIEIRRGGVSYTYDTILALQEELGPGAQTCFIVGADMLPTLHTWHRAEELVAATEWAFVQRPHYPPPDARQLRQKLSPEAIARLTRSVVRLEEAVDISSSEIRRRLCRGEPVDRLIRAPVYDYILSHGLYGTAGGNKP